MNYAILCNPAAGKMNVDRKRSALAEAAEILDAKIHGMDTSTVDEFHRCARDLADRCDVLVVAGGDGTFSDIINAVDTSRRPVAFLPLGTGNSMRYALRYRGSLAAMARRIRTGEIREYDLIDCDGRRRAFTISVGLAGTMVRVRDEYVAEGKSGFAAYAKAIHRSYFREYTRTAVEIATDDERFRIENLLHLMVAKQPYYGYGVNVLPAAKFDDRLLHVLWLSSGLLKTTFAWITAFTIGNRVGRFFTSRKLTVTAEGPLDLQIDGNFAWEADRFTFTVLPGALRIKC